MKGSGYVKCAVKHQIKKANLLNHAEIYMRVYDMIDVSSALHLQQEILFKEKYPSVTIILHSLMDLLLVSSKTTPSSCFLITYLAKIFYVFMNRLVMFGQMFL